MTSKIIRETRCSDVLELFERNNRGMCFLTLTTADVVTLAQIRNRWRDLRHDLIRRYDSGIKYVMNYEMHPNGHGWHIHAVFNRFINLRSGGLASIQRFGFGRVNVKRVTSLGVSLYLSKHCLKSYRGVRQSLRADNFKRLRLVNTSRGLPCLSDYKWKGEYLDRVREIVNNPIFKEYTSHRFTRSRRWQYAELMALTGWNVERLFTQICAMKKKLNDPLAQPIRI